MGALFVQTSLVTSCIDSLTHLRKSYSLALPCMHQCSITVIKAALLMTVATDLNVTCSHFFKVKTCQTENSVTEAPVIHPNSEPFFTIIRNSKFFGLSLT